MISVIVPVYKVEKYFSKCIESILDQTHRDFELILVDDGSPDNCGKMCDEYAQRDDRITVIHKENGGLSSARNAGLEYAFNGKSEYVTFIDSDDRIHPRFLELMLKAICENNAKISVCTFDHTDDILSFDFSPCENTTSELLTPGELFLNHTWDYNYAWGKLYRKDLFFDIRFPEGKNFEDVFTTYKALYKCESLAYLSEPLYCYFKNEEGITHSLWNKSELVIFEGMKEQLDFYKTNGYEEAYDKEFELYVHHHAYQIARIKANKTDFKKNKPVLKALKADLRRYLREYKNIFNVHNMSYSYEAAYPVFMKLYGFASKVKSVLLRRNV